MGNKELLAAVKAGKKRLVSYWLEHGASEYSVSMVDSDSDDDQRLHLPVLR